MYIVLEIHLLVLEVGNRTFSKHDLKHLGFGKREHFCNIFYLERARILIKGRSCHHSHWYLAWEARKQQHQGYVLKKSGSAVLAC